jgi:Flp pilus assembly protein TadD
MTTARIRKVEWRRAPDWPVARGGVLSLRYDGGRRVESVSARAFRARICAVYTMAVLSICPTGLLAASVPTVQAQCIAPPEMRAKIAASPSADNYANLGAWYADQKKFSCAAAEYAVAIRHQPQSASYVYLWGLSLHSAGDEKGALTALKKATQLDINDIRPHLALGAVYDKLNRAAESEAEYRAALAIDPDSIVALDSLSKEFIDRKDYASVVVLLDKPSSGRTRTATQSLNLGIAYAADARLDDATRVLRDGLNDAPDSLAIADELAVVLMLRGLDKEAYALLDSVVARHPEDKTTQVLYLHILVSSHGDKASEVANLLITKYPDNWEVQYLNGLLEMRDGNFSSARNLFERSIALKADYDHAHADLGSTLAALGDLPDAKAELEKAIDLGDKEPEVEYNLARVLLRMGENAQAQEHLKIYQKLKGTESGRAQAAGKAEEADQAMSQGDAAKAASLYREAIDSDPGEAILYYKLSRALDKLSDQAEEKNALERAIALNPGLAEAQNQMGYLVVHAGDAAGAEAYFRAAVQASPSYVSAWINLAATLAAEEKWNDARQAVNQALQVDPGNTQARGLDQMISEAHPAP